MYRNSLTFKETNGIINKKQRGIFMKPRVFVSSTFYDLKYVREDIANFIKAHDFEPIMFEDGDIGYTPGKPLDKSCYETMRSADMVILIIGGNYGSPSSTDESVSEVDFGEYVSITRKEFKTAVDLGIPIFAFIEASVNVEYNIYELNKKNIQNNIANFKFSATKDINVFSFISEIKSIGNISITEFKKPSEIKDFLGKQWADMFKNYLRFLMEKEQGTKMHYSIDELCSSVKEMQILINGLFEKTFNNQKEIQYDSLKQEQRNLRAKMTAKSINRYVSYDFLEDEYTEYDVRVLTEDLIDLICKVMLDSTKIFKGISEICDEIFDKALDLGISIDSINPKILNEEYIIQLKDDETFKAAVIDELIKLRDDN